MDLFLKSEEGPPEESITGKQHGELDKTGMDYKMRLTDVQATEVVLAALEVGLCNMTIYIYRMNK